MKRMADVTNVSVNQLDASEENEEEYNKMGHGVLEPSDQK